MKNFIPISIYPSSNRARPVITGLLRGLYGMSALLILLNAAFMYMGPADWDKLLDGPMDHDNPSIHSDDATVGTLRATSLQMLGISIHSTPSQNTSNNATCDNPACHCTPDNHCGCLDGEGHGHGQNDMMDNEKDHAHSGDSSRQICGCTADSNAEGPTTSTNILNKNWLIEHHLIRFPLKSLFQISSAETLHFPLLPDEIFHPPA